LKWLVAALCVGYVLPAYSILRKMAEARDKAGLVGLKVDGTAQVPQAAAADYANALGVTATPGELQLSMVVSIRFPARCRVELGSLDSTRTVVAVSNNGKRRSEGTELPALQVLTDEICALLALRGDEDDVRESIQRHLGSLKIDARYSALGRFAGGLVFLIGAPQPNAPHLAVYKDGDQQPARIKFTDTSGASWDVRFLDYTSQSTGGWFPRLVEVWKGDQLQLRLTTLNSDGKPKLDDKLF
jgi:hypothetical protein